MSGGHRTSHPFTCTAGCLKTALITSPTGRRSPLASRMAWSVRLATRSVQQRQWNTLHRLAARFADTVQGLSTLKVFGRQHRATASIEQVTGEYRRETMRVLRVSFLSGFALEFLASISVAIIAVSIGFRLIDGALVLGVVGAGEDDHRDAAVPLAQPDHRGGPVAVR